MNARLLAIPTSRSGTMVFMKKAPKTSAEAAQAAIRIHMASHFREGDEVGSRTGVMMTLDVQLPDLAARTLQLVDVPSESRSEAALVALVREVVPCERLYDDGEVLLFGERD